MFTQSQSTIFRAVPACILSQYHWDKAFHFAGQFHFLVKTIADSVRLGVVYLNLVVSTANRVIFNDIYLLSAAYNAITTILLEHIQMRSLLSAY